jgi:hypothetical protein
MMEQGYPAVEKMKGWRRSLKQVVNGLTMLFCGRRWNEEAA